MRLTTNPIKRFVLIALVGLPYLQVAAGEPLSCNATALPGDQVRGCCVYKTDKAICVKSNKGFCRTTANEKDIGYKFYPGAACRDIAQCKSAE